MIPADLSRQATAHVERAASLSGHALPTRRNHAALDALADATRAHPEARREWLAAVALWWRMAEFVRPVARGTARIYSVTETDDLVQDGMIGAFDAARLWSPDRGITFRNYARHWVRARVDRAHNTHGHTIRVSSKAAETVRIAGKARARMEQAGAEVTTGAVRGAVAAAAGLLAPSLEAALAARQGVRSLSAPVADAEGLTLGDTLAADAWDPEADLDTRAALSRLPAALKRLPKRQAEVIRRQYLEEEPVRVQARAMGLCVESVRTARQRALAQLRAEVAA